MIKVPFNNKRRLIPDIPYTKELRLANTRKGFFFPGVYTFFFILMALISLYTIFVNLALRYNFDKQVYLSYMPWYLDFLFATIFSIWKEKITDKEQKLKKFVSLLCTLCFLSVLVYDVFPPIARIIFSPDFKDFKLRYHLILIKNFLFLLTSLLSIKPSLIYFAPRGPYKKFYFDYNPNKRPAHVRLSSNC